MTKHTVILKGRQNNTGGFTLVEVMVSVFVFSLVLLGVLSTMIMAQRLGESARNRLVAMQHARASVEELLSSSYLDSDVNTGTHSITRGGLSGRYTVTEVISGEMKEIILSYTYASFGRTAEVELLARMSNALH